MRCAPATPSREMRRRDDDWTVPSSPRCTASPRSARRRSCARWARRRAAHARRGRRLGRLLDRFRPGEPGALRPTSWTCLRSDPSRSGISTRQAFRTVSGARRRPADGPLGEATTWCSSLRSATCSAAENRDLLRRCHAALAAGGRVVIQDFILEPDKAPRGALLALNMLVGHRPGSSYTEEEYAGMAARSGIYRRKPHPSRGSDESDGGHASLMSAEC